MRCSTLDGLRGWGRKLVYLRDERRQRSNLARRSMRSSRGKGLQGMVTVSGIGKKNWEQDGFVLPQIGAGRQ